jgi:hypothetical protein
MQLEPQLVSLTLVAKRRCRDFKRAWPTLTDKEVSFELMQDAAHYKRYSHCKNLACLVYDPQV